MSNFKITTVIFLRGFTMASGNTAAWEGGKIGINTGGRIPTKPHEYPSVIAIYNSGDSGIYVECGGAIIDPNWIITTAVCAYWSTSSYKIVAGEHNLTLEEGTEQRCSVIQRIRHEKLNNNTGENDIALMRVSPPFVLNDVVGVAELPPQRYIVDGNTIFIGWGNPRVSGGGTLQHVVVPFLKDTKCRKSYSIFDSMICTGDSEVAIMCLEERGCPLNHNGKLVGLYMGGWGCGQKGFPGVYTEVSYYIDWINKTMSS